MRLPSYFISHGGGPWPWIDTMAANHHPLADSLSAMPAELPHAPQAVLMVSAHWESADAYQVMSHARPAMLYDYYNFPPHTYEVDYPAPGAPQLAQQTLQLIRDAGLPVSEDSQRGFDHGCFVPMSLMYPAADMPLYQLSIRSHYDVGEHIALGQALAPLRDQGVLIVASGLSYHNLRRFGGDGREPSQQFDQWLYQTLQLSGAQRLQALQHWQQAPAARICHPREDHLVPLFVAAGAAQESSVKRVYRQQDLMGAITASSFRFG
ncbi:DODA-type extradiol aromatic ring-opening family dioxygenase [Bacterioplanoides pacificum]|uniref:DODA-type extradiol aromatic ring-opening family dioxygenase n=1 Tax=Bacterioplanoides pacificum TaxID=1171596 RepID=A0ABV7VR10_9GAMM